MARSWLRRVLTTKLGKDQDFAHFFAFQYEIDDVIVLEQHRSTELVYLWKFPTIGFYLGSLVWYMALSPCKTLFQVDSFDFVRFLWVGILQPFSSFLFHNSHCNRQNLTTK